MDREAETVRESISRFLEGMPDRGFAVATCRARAALLRPLERWAEQMQVRALADLGIRELDAYQASLFAARRPDGNRYAVTTIAHRVSALRMLFAWALRTGRIRTNAASALVPVRTPRRLPRAILTEGEVERVLAMPRTETRGGLRDRALLKLLYSTGIRRSELARLDLTDLDADRGVLSVREGKGGKDRVVPVGSRALSWVARYLAEVRHLQLPAAGRGALFLNDRGNRIRPNRLTDRLRRYLVASGVAKPGSCHIWRHTMATLMHDGGADIRDLQEILGHADLSTTEIYTHVSIRRLQRVHAETHPAERGQRHGMRGVDRWRGG